MDEAPARFPGLRVREPKLQTASAGCCRVHFSEVVLGYCETLALGGEIASTQLMARVCQ